MAVRPQQDRRHVRHQIALQMRNADRKHRQALQDQQGHQEDRQDDDPVEHEVAQIDGNARPRIGRENAHLGGEIVAVGAQPGGRDRLDVRAARPSHQVAPHRGEIRALPPRRQPAAHVAAARHGRQVVELRQQRALRLRDRVLWIGLARIQRNCGLRIGMVLEHLPDAARSRMRRQRLDHAEAECRAAYPASRQAERRPIEPVERLVQVLLVLRTLGAFGHIVGFAGDPELLVAQPARRIIALRQPDEQRIVGIGPDGERFLRQHDIGRYCAHPPLPRLAALTATLPIVA